MNRIRSAALATALLATAGVSAQTPTVVKDIRTEANGSAGSFPDRLTTFGDELMLWADDGRHGQELWAVNPASGEKRLVVDLNPGPGGTRSFGGVAFDGRFVFTADNRRKGHELWATDGTAEGTKPLQDSWTNYRFGWPRELTVTADSLFFFDRTDEFVRSELWRLPAGTSTPEPVRSFAMPGGYAFAGGMVAFGDGVLFAVNANDDLNAGAPDSLWSSDGTTAGTQKIADFDFIDGLEIVGNTVVFSAATGSSSGLYAISTALENPQLIAPVSSARGFAALDDQLVFQAFTSGSGLELWKTDGTAAGTAMLKEIAAGAVGSDPRTLVRKDDAVYFIAYNGSVDSIWVTDGTEAGTTQVVSASSLPGAPESWYNLVVAGDLLYFDATTDTQGRELWQTDGTTAGTGLVADLAPGSDSGLTPLLSTGGRQALDSRLLFGADDLQDGREAWLVDGGAPLNLNINDAPGSRPRQLAAQDAEVFFLATTAISAEELWRSDGTETGTVQATSILGDRVPQLYDFSVVPRLELERTTPEHVYLREFYRDGFSIQAQLWRYDHTTDETELLAPASPLNSMDMATLSDGRALFVGNDDSAGREPWITDGSAVGTAILKDINANGSSSPSGFTAFAGHTYFAASDGVAGIELWRTDGTAAGTVLFADAWPGSESSSPASLTVVGDTLYFRAADNAVSFLRDDRELWRVTDDLSGVEKVSDINPTDRSNPTQLTAFGNVLMFAATGENGRELWRSDGTSAGTVEVKDIVTGAPGSNPASLTVVGTQLFFTADDPQRGNELWVSDGTTPGTRLVRDIAPGAASSAPADLTAFGDFVVFSADSGAGDRELWVSNGRRGGTIQLADILPGAAGAYPHDLVVAGQTLYLAAQDEQLGIELWRLDALVDVDVDGIANAQDNCSFVANADQLDTDGDGFGNACDADFNNDCTINVVDLGYLRSVFFSNDALADINGDGVVNVTDLGRVKDAFFSAPGPSGIASTCTAQR